MTERDETAAELERENAALRASLQRMLDAFEGWGETTSPACAEARALLQKRR